MNEHGTRGALREAWRIARPYWVSEERWTALGLLILVVTLSLGQVALNVRFSYWYNAFYNTLQNLDAHGFYVQIALFAGLATLWVLIGTSRGFLSQMLRIRWRRWLTDLYLKRWLDHRAYYRLQLTGPAAPEPHAARSVVVRALEFETHCQDRIEAPEPDIDALARKPRRAQGVNKLGMLGWTGVTDTMSIGARCPS